MRTNFLIILSLVVDICIGQITRSVSSQFCNCRIVLVGEEHKLKENYLVTYSMLAELHSKNIFPKHMLLELGQGTASLLNRYLNTRERKLLDIAFPLKEDQLFYMKLASLDSSLADHNKFEFSGVDYDYSYGIIYSSLQYILLTEAERLQAVSTSIPFESLEENEKYDYLIKSLINKKDPDTWSDKDLKKDLNLILDVLNSKDSSLLLKRIGDNISEVKLILAGYQLTSTGKHPLMYNLESSVFKEKREAFMARNIYSLFEKDTSAILFGQFGSFHTIFKSDRRVSREKIYDRFADALDNNKVVFPLTNRKICTSIILYKKLLKRQSKFYNLNFKKLSADFEELRPGTLSVQPCRDNILFDNILLFKE
jgi:hypothetical protein